MIDDGLSDPNGRRADRAALAALTTVGVAQARIQRDAEGNVTGITPNRRERRARSSAQRKGK